MFIAAAAGGVLVVGVLSHDDHSNYSDHNNHSQYGDSYLVNAITKKEKQISQQEEAIDEFREHIKNKFESRLNELRKESDYTSLYSEWDDIWDDVNKEMQQEIKDSIKNEQEELQKINKMIARINEIEMQDSK